jgi:predicted acylesterase/phospholipase RssA
MNFTRRSVLSGMAGVAVSGCASVARLSAPDLDQPQGYATSYLGIAKARFLPDEQPQIALSSWLDAERRQARAGVGYPAPSHFLALSGGGGDGAYGAGVLFGWTERGDRPSFSYVTGVSTGALIAPFAFLGSAYDSKLQQLYTSLSDDDIATRRPLLSLLSSDALSDTKPLAARIEEALTDAMVASIAAEHRKGRALLIGTTNLDLARAVTWDIGVIANSGHPEAASVIRRILLASASIPAVFPPVLFDVDAGGAARQELHVDGGVSNQLFLYSPSLTLAQSPENVRRRRRHVWIIRNGRFLESSQQTERGLIPIATRSVSALIASNALGDIYRSYVTSSRDGIDYNLAYIRSPFAQKSKTAFDREYMASLFEHGRSEIKRGAAWSKMPPGFSR